MKGLVFLVEAGSEGEDTAQAVKENSFMQSETMAELKSMIRDVLDCRYDKPSQ